MKKELITLLLSGMFVTSGWASETYPVEVSSQPDQKWRFQRLTAYKVDDFVTVSGRLTANIPFGLPRGHVDIAGYSSTGELLTETTTDYVPAILTHAMKKKGGVRFSATLDRTLPSDAVIKVAFHREDPMIKIKPAHSGNIAR